LNEKLIKFTLPSQASAPISVESPEPRPDAPTKARILVAEDDPVSRTLITTRLEKWGYDVISTNDGAQAMAILRGRNAPLLAILDWSMPQMDGLEICRRLRAVDKMIYVIVLTAHGAKENIIEGLRAGADDYLVKPFDPEELHARILVGLRAMTSQETLAARVHALEMAVSNMESTRLQIPL
jgi:DNA-binding response OmpR family regulator